MNCVEDITRWQVDDKEKSSQKLGYVWALPFRRLLSKISVCVWVPTCLNHSLKTPKKHNSLLYYVLFKDKASFLPWKWNSIQGRSITAADSAQGPNLLVAISATRSTTTKKWTWIDHQNAVGTMQWITNSTKNTMTCTWGVPLQLSWIYSADNILGKETNGQTSDDHTL